ncbi:MAG TPA: tetratricopeptide repeat protein [Rhizomicrobium sp.]|nr:tetratricopeptide repeat protein [Rhizomicrobium sp.]
MTRATKRLLAGTAALALMALVAPPVYADDDAPQAPSASSDVSADIARAHALREQGNLKEAASVLAQLMLVQPDDARIVGEYGKVMAEEKRGDDALAFLQRAVALNDGDWTLWSALGVAFDENNNPGDAAAAYKRALALKPGEPAVLNNYAMSRLLAGDYVGAQELFEQIQGANDPRIANNKAMAAEILAARMPARTPARAPAMAAAPKYTAPASAPVKAQALAEAATPANAAPSTHVAAAATPDAAPSHGPIKSESNAPGATGAPRAIVLADGDKAIMQAVPKDPLAGPVKPRTAPAAHRAATHRMSVAERKAATTAPALRTAADTH